MSEAYQALAAFALSLMPLALVALRDAWVARRKVHSKRARDPP